MNSLKKLLPKLMFLFSIEALSLHLFRSVSCGFRLDWPTMTFKALKNGRRLRPFVTCPVPALYLTRGSKLPSALSHSSFGFCLCLFYVFFFRKMIAKVLITMHELMYTQPHTLYVMQDNILQFYDVKQLTSQI